ncbi:aldehyde dehydrogenase family protein [uncultured Paludibaculum sp.]|uniref:aldehyde dehydrogenase family protein n=1 Tax=uncultured Paludibaculum sp. TaxID=1765020 RepID=UPI002AAAE093|nr:aldehyde dehydrogenase family protein [uncultured Paludibaculum sp.]
MNTPIFPNYIDGAWVEGPTFENRNPADISEVVGLHGKGSPEDIQRAADAAQSALAAWSTTSGPARGALLYRIADILDRKFDQISAEMTREEGKTLPEAKGEVRRSINIFRYFAGEGSRMAGVMAPSERDRVHMFALRKPVGVVGLITPWNFPSAIPAWKLAPALICGNTVVMKPASAAPLSAWRIIEACHEAGVPKGVVNFVGGSGGALGAAIVNAKPIKAISFTGSCEIGQWIHAEASKRRLRIQLEMGGKNPTIVLADADFASAVENCVNATFFSTGQKCTATSRVIVEEGIYDKFVAAVVERTKKLKVGNGMQPGIDIGPCVDEGQMNTVLRYIEIGRKEAGEPLCGGHRLTGGDYDKGYFVEPTVFAGITEEMVIAREEIFGPVMAILKARDFQHAMQLANGSDFGLSASLQTTNLSRMFEYIYGIEAGLVTVNLPSAGVEYQLPFGGSKDSSFGPKEQGPAALEFYSDHKTVYIKY